MSSHTAIIEQLDVSIGAILAGRPVQPNGDANLNQLLQVAADLRYLPRPEFKARLRARLEQPAMAARPAHVTAAPSLLLSGQSAYPARPANFLASLALHTAAAAALLASGLWVGEQSVSPREQIVALVSPDFEEVLPPAPRSTAGGGGGGDRDVLEASKGGLPPSAMEQFTPPAAVIRNPKPELAVAPTVVAPDLKAPKFEQLGDPLAGVTGPPSNGIGSGGGVGSGKGGGIGSGSGPGIGPGKGGGLGGGVYRVGGGVSAPRAIYSPDPVYSDEARKAKHQGTVVLWVVVGPDGRAHDVRVSRYLGMGLDEKAVEAVRQWRFEPAEKDGRPVAVQINVEVNFRLY